MDGLIHNADGTFKPGRILALWKELRENVGVLVARKKEGVRFKVRSADELVDKVRDKANELGILIYPASGTGKGQVIEDGTQAEVDLVVVAQSVEDGSRLGFWGFGLGADSQDKAGGKAGTYAFKAALIQSLLAGGKDNAKALGVADTDDSDTPIEGGVKPKTRAKAPTVDEAKALLQKADSEEDYKAAIKRIMTMQPANQLLVKDTIIETKARINDPGRSKNSEK